MKIYAALEDWDDVIKHHLPNGCNKNWVEEGGYLRTLGTYLSKDYLDKGVVPHVVLPDYSGVEYIHKSALVGTNKKYLYIIFILNVTFFSENAEDGFKYVDPKVLEDVKNGKCNIVFIQDTEGMSGMKGTQTEFDFLLIQKWCDNSGLPSSNVHYICGNVLSDQVAKRQGCSFNVIPLTVQDIWINIEDFPNKIMDFNPTDEKYLYLNYSRRPRYHRVFFYSSLLKEGIFHKGTNSFNDMGWPLPINQLHRSDPMVVEHAKELYRMSPVLIDRENASDDITLYMNLNDYERTFISVVTETLYEEDTLFNSEKIWKPIIMGHPFILLGNQYHLQWLRDQGFKTFGKWIDESYDTEPRMEDRSNKIISELKRLGEMDINELKRIREEMNEVCRFNKDHMRNRVKQRFYGNGEYDRNQPTTEQLMKIYSNMGKDTHNDINYKSII